MVKKHHNKEHKLIKFNVDDKVYLNLHQGYKLGKNDSHHKLGVQCTGSYRVLEQIGNLAYWLKLSETMQIHNVVSMTQLKPHSEANLYKRESQFNPSLVEKWENEQYYKIDAVVNKKIIYENLQYKVKWTGYSFEKNIWLWPNDIQAKDPIQKYKKKQHQTINGKSSKWGQKWSHELDKTLSLYHNWISIADTSSPAKRS